MQVFGLSCSAAACSSLLICSLNWQMAHQSAHVCECYVLDLAGSSAGFGRVVEEFVLLQLLAVIFHPPPEVQQLFTRCGQCWHAHKCETGKQSYQPSVPEMQQLIWISKPITTPLGPWIEREVTGSCHTALFDPIQKHLIGQVVCLALMEMASCQTVSLPSRCACADRYRGVCTD